MQDNKIISIIECEQTSYFFSPNKIAQEYVLQGQVSSNQDEQLQQLQQFRKNLDQYGKAKKDENGLQILSVKDYYEQRAKQLNTSSLNDISSLRSDYVKRGGQNSEFLQNLYNMEKYFNGKSQYQNLINNPNSLQIQRNQNPLTASYSLPLINQNGIFDSFQNELQNFSMLNNQNQLSIPAQLRGSVNQLSYINNNSLAGNKSDQEQMYDYLSQQESQLLLDMSRLHPNSYNFQNKKDQYQKIRVLKNEIEKSMIFNRVNQSVNAFQPSLGKSMMMPASIPTKLVDYSSQNDYFAQRNGAYYAKEGFIIRFDYIALIPPNFDQVQINFGVYKKGQSLDTYLKTATYNAEMESHLSQKCIFTEKRNIHEVQPHIDFILYFEMYANERDPLKRTMVKRAWTMHEIFDTQLILNCGRFKLPFYNKNLNPQLLLKTGLPQMTDSSLFVRICFPNDPNLDNNTYVFIENEYKVPYFHLKNQIAVEQNNQNKQSLFPPPQVQIIRDEYNRANQQKDDLEKARLQQLQQDFDSQYLNSQNMDKPQINSMNKPLNKNNASNQQLQIPQQIKPQQQQQQSQQQLQAIKPKQSDQAQKPPMLKLQPVNQLNESGKSFYQQPHDSQDVTLQQPKEDISKRISDDMNLTDGVVVKVQNVHGFMIDEQDVRINLKIFEGNQILFDDMNKECNEMFESKLVKGSTKLDIERVFEIKIKEMLKTYKKLQLDKVFLFINILSGNLSLGWLVTSLFKSTQQKPTLNNGRFHENLNKPPAKNPPFMKINTKSKMQIDYIIHDPDLLEDEVNEFDTIQSNTNTAKKSIDQRESSPRNQKNQMTDGLIIPQSQKVDKVDGPRNVLMIEMDTLKNYKNNLSISYDLVILKPQEIVNDEFGNPSVYHFDELIPPSEDIADQIDFKTTVKVPLDIELAMNKKSPNWDQYFIIFKFVEVDDDDKEMTLGWMAHPLFKNNKINQGVFTELLYDTPLQVNVPLNKSIIKKRQEKLTYKINVQKLPAEEYNLLQRNNENTIAASEIKSETQQRSVFTVVIHNLRNMESNVDLQVNVALLLNDDFMNDDNNQQCTFQGDVKECNRNNVQFLEEYNFELDIRKLAVVFKQQLNKINLVIYLLTKNKQPKYWFFCKLFDNNGNPHIGTFESKVFNIPIQKMTTMNTKKLKETKSILKYSFLEGIQDEDLESQYSPD